MTMSVSMQNYTGPKGTRMNCPICGEILEGTENTIISVTTNIKVFGQEQNPKSICVHWDCLERTLLDAKKFEIEVK